MSRGKSKIIKRMVPLVVIIVAIYSLFVKESSILTSFQINSIKQTNITKNLANLFENDSTNSLFSSEEILEGQITDCNAEDSVSISYSEAERIYDRTSNFNHVDIRVNGTFNVNNKTYNIKIQNVSLKVINGSKTIVNTSFKNNQSYEWRVTNITVPKSAQVILEFDILLDGEVVRENYVTTYEGREDFVQAIVDCDMHWGLDFKIDATEIVAVALPNVSYQWTNLPEGLATLPEPVLGYDEGATHTLETNFTRGKYIVDEKNGKLYTFSGWTEWSNANDNHRTKNTIVGSNITVLADTIIYGNWISSDLEYKESIIELSQNFTNNFNYLPENLSYKITTPSGKEETILYTNFKNNKYTLLVSEEGNYTIEQLNNSIKGFTLTSVKAETEISTISNKSEKIIVKTDLEYKLPTDSTQVVQLGQIVYTNEYTKKMGESVYNYPTLEIETSDLETKEFLSGAKYTLTKTDNAQAESAPSNDKGLTSFEKIKEGTYILTETTAPKNYYKDQTTYTINVNLKDNKAEEIYNSETEEFILIYNYIIELTPNENFNLSNNKLSIVNQEIKGSISLSVDFSNQSDITKENYPSDKAIIIQITNENGYKKELEVNSKNNWQSKVENLKLGIYKIKELKTESSIPGYDLIVDYDSNVMLKGETNADFTLSSQRANSPDNSITVNLSEETKDNQIKIVTTYKKIYGESVYNYPTLEIETSDSETKELLSGAKYTLTKTDNAQAESAPSNDKGLTSFEKIKEGTYTLTETTAPKNYYKDQTTYTINIKLKDNKAEEIYDSEKEKFILIYNYEMEISPQEKYDITNNRLSISNQEIKGSISIAIDFGKESDITSANYPATGNINILITNAAGYRKEVLINNTNGWKVKIDDLKLGTYKVKELKTESSIPGYSLVTDYNGDNNPKESIEIALTSEQNDSNITIINTYTQIIDDIEVEAAFTIRSVDDANQPITGATFELYNPSEEKIAEETTDENGIATFDGLKTSGIYSLVLTDVPDKYIIKDRKWTLEVFLPTENPPLEYDEKTNSFKRIHEYKVSMENSNFSDDTLTITTEKQEEPKEEQERVETEDDVPLTAENNYRFVYILITLFGIFGLVVTIYMKKPNYQ